jgi:hypothetical protein
MKLELNLGLGEPNFEFSQEKLHENLSGKTGLRKWLVGKLEQKQKSIG